MVTVTASLRTRWRAEVYTSGLVDDQVRILLLRLLEDMDFRGNVSVPRSVLADDLGIHPSNVTARVTKAKRAGFLDVVRAGRPGVTAEYIATMPGINVVRHHAQRRTKPDTSNTAAHMVRTRAHVRTIDLPALGATTRSSSVRQGSAGRSATEVVALPLPLQRRCGVVGNRNAREDLRRRRGTG